MSMNETPSAQRTHIGFFGCRNAGKASLVNAVTAQELSVVSPMRGTTTDQNTIGAINAAINDINANPQAFDQRIPLTRKTVKALTSVVADCIKEQLKQRNARGVKFRDSAIAASLAAGYRQALNERLWPVINKTFAATAGNRPVKLTSTITPADNFQPVRPGWRSLRRRRLLHDRLLQLL